jgi:hypothetical protein
MTGQQVVLEILMLCYVFLFYIGAYCAANLLGDAVDNATTYLVYFCAFSAILLSIAAIMYPIILFTSKG